MPSGALAVPILQPLRQRQPVPQHAAATGAIAIGVSSPVRYASGKARMHNALSPVLKYAGIVGVCVVNGLLAALFLGAPAGESVIDPAAIRHEQGYGYLAAPDIAQQFPFAVLWDDSAHPQRANATLLENGTPAGPAHALHDDIRMQGGGRFSFWAGALYFSTADNSDPSRNGRVYTLRYRAAPAGALIYAIALLDGIAIIAFRRPLAGFARRWGVSIAAGVVSLLLLRIAASALGFAPPIFANSASPLDGNLVVALIVQFALGATLTAVIFAAGLGILRVFNRGGKPFEDLLLAAFLPGIAAVCLAAIIAVALPYGRGLAISLLLASLYPLRGYRPEPRTLRHIGRTIGLTLPAVLCVASAMSFEWHGPTATLAANPLGDTTIAIGRAHSFSQQILPFFNREVEHGAIAGYGNQVPSLLMAPLVGYSWFDPFLFLTAALIVVLLASLGGLLAALDAARRAENPALRLDRVSLLVVAGLLVGAARYPAVYVESPMEALMVPIVVSTVHLWLSARGSVARLGAALATAAIGSAVSKIVSLVVLFPLPLPELGRILLRRSRRPIAVAAALGLLAVAVHCTILLKDYLPQFLAIGEFGPNSWQRIIRGHLTAPLPVIAVAGRDIGAIVLAVAASRLRLAGLTIAAWAGVAAYLAMPFLFHTTLTALMLVLAFVLVRDPCRVARARRLLAAATALLLLDPFVSDPGNDVLLGLWALAVCFIVWVALCPPEAERPTPSARRQRGFAVVTAVLLAAVLPATALGTVWAGPREGLIFTPAMRDIWLAVRDRTPPDALIFTDQTGPTQSRVGGWNDYALMAERQFYLVSWANHPMRFDHDLLQRWLDENDAVLSGRMQPGELRLTRRYGSYYLVISVHRTAPPGARLVYENAAYRLYRLSAPAAEPPS
jgi:hypothetical protein